MMLGKLPEKLLDKNFEKQKIKCIMPAIQQYEQLVQLNTILNNRKSFLEEAISKMGEEAEQIRESGKYDNLISDIDDEYIKGFLPAEKKEDKLMIKFVRDFLTEFVVKVQPTLK